MLNLAGLLTHERFRKWRRVIIFAVFAFAAVATPSPDPLTMLLLAIPCVVLVEIAEVFTWLNDRRRARLPQEDFAGLHGEPSRIDLDGVDEDAERQLPLIWLLRRDRPAAGRLAGGAALHLVLSA